MTTTTIKKTKINVSDERQAVKDFNARIAAINKAIREHNLNKLGTTIETIDRVPALTMTLHRGGLDLVLSIESRGLIATVVTGKTRVVLFHDATDDRWSPQLYAGKGEPVSMVTLESSDKAYVKAVYNAAKQVIKTFNLDKMNTANKVGEIVDACNARMTELRPKLDELERKLGLVTATVHAVTVLKATKTA